jgi:outer membrane protein assembly factor BamB
MPRRVVLTLAIFALPLCAGAAQPQFWRIEGAKDFLEGTTDGIAVDSEGRVRLSPAASVIHDPEAPYVWCLARDAKGALYAGTGNDGKVFRIESGSAKLFFDAAELEVHALTAGPDGRLYVGTSPDGKVYAVDAEGKATTFYDPPDKYIWGLAFDSQGNLFVTTGADARVYRVDKKGEATVVLTSADTHVISLVADGKGTLYAGSSPAGIIYRIDAAGKVFVLSDTAYREVKALDLGNDGSVYAAVVDGKDESPRPAPASPMPTPGAAVLPEVSVSVSESFSLPPSAQPAQAAAPRPADSRPSGTKGALLRLLPTGEVETLWISSEDMPHAILETDDGVLVATGNAGKVYRVRNDRSWEMVASFPSDQVTALCRGAAGSVFLGTSNAGRIYSIAGRAGERGTFTSKVKDTETVSGWGRIRWEASTPSGTRVEIQTRGGNTGAPDSTWSDWSAVYTHADGEAVTTERARFIQVRAVFVGADGATPRLDSISTAYLQRNLRPQINSITVHPPGEVFQKPLGASGEVEILGLDDADKPEPRLGALSRPQGSAPITAFSRRLQQKGLQTFSWKADDPNGDSLVYDVFYRAASETRFRPLRRGLEDPVLAWDTSTVPNGRYVIRVVARDTPSNPEALALSGDKVSAPFDVDNTPPRVTASLVPGKPPRIRAAARDDDSIIRRAEYTIDGGRWHEVHPTDGINDALEETYEIVLDSLPGQGPHIIVLRAQDLLGNVASTQVEVP